MIHCFSKGEFTEIDADLRQKPNILSDLSHADRLPARCRRAGRLTASREPGLRLCYAARQEPESAKP
jgi:hypothetical protein